MNINIILPECSDDLISNGLRELTKAIHDKHYKDVHILSGLGGENGYGENFSNNIFLMHRFCWCEEPNCPYCGGCDCPDSAYHFFVDGKEVTHKEYDDFFTIETDKKFYPDKDVKWLQDNWIDLKKRRENNSEWMQLADNANERRKVVKDDICDYCKVEGTWNKYKTEFGYDKEFGTPLFWHKPSDFKIVWYKYIGRDMRMNRDVSESDWNKVIKECIESV